jgi:hypothetical protein
VGLSRYGTNNFKINTEKLGDLPKKRATAGRPRNNFKIETGDSVTETGDSVTETGDSVTETGDSESPDPSFIHPDPSYSEEISSIIEEANKVVDFILQQVSKERLSWSGREKIPESLWPLADIFVSITGLKPAKKELVYWMGEWSDWAGWGSTPQDVADAYDYSRRDNGGFLVSSPGSLSKTVRAITAKRKDKQAAQSSKPTQDLPTVPESWLKAYGDQK